VQETGSDMFGDYVNNLRFDYSSAGKDEIASRLIGFSGGYVKNSAFLKKVSRLNMFPYPRQSNHEIGL